MYYISETITPRSGIPIDTIAFQTIDILQSDSSLADTQVFLKVFLKECHEGLGGFDSGSVGGVGVGGLLGRVDVGGFRDKSPGGVSGGRGGNGDEYNDQDVGK